MPKPVGGTFRKKRKAKAQIGTKSTAKVTGANKKPATRIGTAVKNRISKAKAVVTETKKRVKAASVKAAPAYVKTGKTRSASKKASSASSFDKAKMQKNKSKTKSQPRQYGSVPKKKYVPKKKRK